MVFKQESSNMRFENGKIYKLYFDENSKYYLGSTTNSLIKRL